MTRQTGTTYLASALFIVCSLGCAPNQGRSDPPAGNLVIPPELEPPEPEQPQSLLRVDVVRSEDGRLSIASIDRTERTTSPRFVPLAPSGDAVAVAYAGDQALGIDVVRMPRTATTLTSDGEHDEPIPLAQPSYTALIPYAGTVTRVALMLADGTVLDERPVIESKQREPPFIYKPFKRYPEIRVLYLDQDEAYLTKNAEDLLAPLSQPSQLSIELIEQALDEMGPAAASAVRNVGFTECPTQSTAAAGVAYGSTIILLREDCFKEPLDRSMYRRMFVHEAAHSFTFLVDAAFEDTPFDLAEWDGLRSGPAAQQVAALQLSDGLSQAWGALHKTGVDLGLALPYTRDYQARAVSDANAVSQGFATAYGSVNEYEDIATLVEELQLPKQPDPTICQRLRSATPQNFPLELALPLAKVEFASALGLVTPDRRRDCLRDMALHAEPGIYLHGKDGVVAFSEEVFGGRRTDDDGTPLLNVFASGGGYDAMLELEAGAGQGLGLRRLDTHPIWLVATLGYNSLIVVDPEDSVRSRLSSTGLALVTEVSPDHLQGLLFMVTMRSALFPTDQFAFGTFRLERPQLQ